MGETKLPNRPGQVGPAKTQQNKWGYSGYSYNPYK